MKQLFDQRCKQYPLDARYISVLAKGLGLKKSDHCKLFSVMGREELLDHLTRSSYRDFVHQGDWHDPRFRMNLHMHSVCSDGSFSLEDYLEKGQQYASLSAKKVDDLDRLPALTLGLTDHDTIHGLQELLKILALNPEKYQNLRVVLGCEFSCAYRSEEMFNQPFSFELLHYGINPFDQAIIKHLSALKRSRRAVLQQIVTTLANRFPFVEFDAVEASFVSDNMFKQQGTNFPFDLLRYAITKLIDAKYHDVIYDICFRTYHMNVNDQDKIYNEVEEVFEHTTDYSLIGLPHPAKMNLTPRILKSKFVEACHQRAYNPSMEATWRIMSDLYQQGMEFVELYYQSYSGDLSASQTNIMPDEMNYQARNDADAWMMHFYNFANRNQLAKTGSYDTHGKTIYRKFN